MNQSGRVAVGVACLALIIGITACQSLAVKPGVFAPSIRLKSANVAAPPPAGAAAGSRRPARFTGITTYVDPRGRYTFRYPSDWPAIANAEGDGAAFVPNAGDPDTVLISHASELSRPVDSRDLVMLSRQVDAEVGRLPDAVIRERNDEAIGEVLRLERVVSFRDGATGRERKIRVLFAGSWQLELSWQGATTDDYDYYLPQANYAFTWFTLAPFLWSAFDGMANAPAAMPSEEPTSDGQSKHDQPSN
jgi:hypothetical protein